MGPRIVLVLAILQGLSGCYTAADQSTPAELSLANARAAEFNARMSYGAYALRPSDQLRIQVYDDQSLNGEYPIDSAGYVSIPLAGRIKASGMTAAQLERAIAARLSGDVLKKPTVNVQVIGYGPVYVHGEVKEAGEFPYRPGLSVADAIAAAGGYSYRADESVVFITRAGFNIERAYKLDHRIPIFPGDNIRIPERFF